MTGIIAVIGKNQLLKNGFCLVARKRTATEVQKSLNSDVPLNPTVSAVK